MTEEISSFVFAGSAHEELPSIDCLVDSIFVSSDERCLVIKSGDAKHKCNLNSSQIEGNFVVYCLSIINC